MELTPSKTPSLATKNAYIPPALRNPPVTYQGKGKQPARASQLRAAAPEFFPKRQKAPRKELKTRMDLPKGLQESLDYVSWPHKRRPLARCSGKLMEILTPLPEVIQREPRTPQISLLSLRDALSNNHPSASSQNDIKPPLPAVIQRELAPPGQQNCNICSGTGQYYHVCKDCGGKGEREESFGVSGQHTIKVVCYNCVKRGGWSQPCHGCQRQYYT